MARLVSAALYLLVAAPVFASEHPSRAVKIIVGFAPGTGTDILARVRAHPVSYASPSRIGQVIVSALAAQLSWCGTRSVLLIEPGETLSELFAGGDYTPPSGLADRSGKEGR